MAYVPSSSEEESEEEIKEVVNVEKGVTKNKEEESGEEYEEDDTFNELDFVPKVSGRQLQQHCLIIFTCSARSSNFMSSSDFVSYCQSLTASSVLCLFFVMSQHYICFLSCLLFELLCLTVSLLLIFSSCL
jgi:hypothetical protein